MLNSIQIVVILLSSFLFPSARGVFPQDPQPCKYGDTDCIKHLINFLLNEKYDGDDGFNLNKIDPLFVKQARIQQGGESSVSMDLQLTDNYIHGWKSAKAVQVKGFGRDMTQKHQLIFTADSLSLVGPYKIDGKILILPIKGSGNSNITMFNVTLKMDFVGKPLQKDGMTYMTLDKYNLEAEPMELKYNVENLFNGDQSLTDNMNLFLNENWKDIYFEVRESLCKAFGKIYQEVIQNVFAKYPYEKFFTE